MSGRLLPHAWILAAAVLVAALVGARAAAQTPPVSLSITITPRVAAVDVPRQLRVQGLTPDESVRGVLIDPYGNETDVHLQADATGSALTTFTPPLGDWTIGLYRVVIDAGGGRSLSVTFAASDGQPHLLEAETLPSPFTAFNVEGIGLPPNTDIALTLFLPGGLGQHTYRVTTDADGILTLFIWPQELGFTFFSAGGYRIVEPTLGLEADWLVREHPVSSTITVKSPVIPGTATAVTFDSYAPNRLVWVVYAAADGTPVGEALVGPTDIRGDTAASFTFSGLAPGSYLMGTPYDWGETEFSVPAPTPTNTPTVTPTPTSTATPTATETPIPCFVTVRLAHKSVRAGARQAVRVTTLPNTPVDVTVRFPTRYHKHHKGMADTTGAYVWSFNQPANRTTPTNTTARVVVQASCSDGGLMTAQKTYHIR